VAGGCGTCIACTKTEKGIHPDVLIVTRLVDQLEQRGEKSGPEQGRQEADQHRAGPRDAAGPRASARSKAGGGSSSSTTPQICPSTAESRCLKTLEEPAISRGAAPRYADSRRACSRTIRSRIQPAALPPRRARGDRERAREAIRRCGRSIRGRGRRKAAVAITLASTEGARECAHDARAEFYTLVGSRLTERFAWAADLRNHTRDTQKRNEEIEMRMVQWGELLRDAAVTAVGAPERATQAETDGAHAEARGGSCPLASSSTSRRASSVGVAMSVETTVSARMLLELLALKLPYRADVVNARDAPGGRRALPEGRAACTSSTPNGNHDLRVNDWVIVKTDLGLDAARVSCCRATLR
jgi:hypothetical protein